MEKSKCIIYKHKPKGKLTVRWITRIWIGLSEWIIVSILWVDYIYWDTNLHIYHESREGHGDRAVLTVRNGCYLLIWIIFCHKTKQDMIQTRSLLKKYSWKIKKIVV